MKNTQKKTKEAKQKLKLTQCNPRQAKKTQKEPKGNLN